MDIIILTVLLPIVAIEVGLLIYRGKHDIHWGYLCFAALLRASIYSPCIIAGVPGALFTTALGGGILFSISKLRDPSDVEFMFGRGIPFITVFMFALICSLIANRKRWRKNDHDKFKAARWLLVPVTMFVAWLAQYGGRWLVGHDEVYYRLSDSGFRWLTDLAEVAFFLGPISFLVSGFGVGTVLVFALQIWSIEKHKCR